MARELFQDGEYRMVIELLKYLPADYPELFKVFDLAAGALTMMDDFNEAVHYGKCALEFKPEMSEFRYNLASNLMVNPN